MIIHGGGLLATAFRAHADLTVPGVVFARGVSDSATTDEDAYRRELALLKAATSSALELGEPIVYFCGAPIYGTFESRRRESDELHPRSRYGRHQLDAEHQISASGARHLILRIPNVVGPGGHPHQLIPALVRQANAGSLVIQSGASRDLLGVEDLVSLTQRLLVQATSDIIVNVATGISTPVEVIAQHVIDILGVDAVMLSEPGGEQQQFDVARLDSLVGPISFGRSYPYDILDRYVPDLAASIR